MDMDVDKEGVNYRWVIDTIDVYTYRKDIYDEATFIADMRKRKQQKIKQEYVKNIRETMLIEWDKDNQRIGE